MSGRESAGRFFLRIHGTGQSSGDGVVQCGLGVGCRLPKCRKRGSRTYPCRCIGRIFYWLACPEGLPGIRFRYAIIPFWVGRGRRPVSSLMQLGSSGSAFASGRVARTAEVTRDKRHAGTILCALLPIPGSCPNTPSLQPPAVKCLCAAGLRCASLALCSSFRLQVRHNLP